MLSENAQFVVQGLGDPRYHALFQELRDQFPNKFSLNLKFDNRLAKLIYAGSDLFLMPSRFEPCGLGQLIALKYGTVPIVRKTGGLADTIENLSLDGKKGTGFVFENYLTEDLLATVRRALETYHQPKIWKGLVQRGMLQDFSWDASAQKYLELYRQIRFQS
jgi:starch synthase